MKTIVVLLLGIGIGIGIFWYVHEADDKNFQTSAAQISNNVNQARENLGRKISEINTQQIKDELARTGQVVRKKAEEAGAKIADATADARITAAIKSEYTFDSELAARDIFV